MSEPDEVIVHFESDELRQARNEAGQDRSSSGSLPPSVSTSSLSGHPNRLNLGLRPSRASTDFFHHRQHPGSFNSSTSTDSLEVMSQPHPDSSDRLQQPAPRLTSSTALDPESSRSSQRSATDAMPTGDGDVSARSQRQQDGVQPSEIVQRLFELAETLRALLIQLAEAQSSGILETPSSYQSPDSPHTTAHSAPPLVPDYTQASTAATCFPSQFDTTQPCPSSSTRCQAHCPIALCLGEMCLAQGTHTGCCRCCRRAAGPCADVGSCGQRKKEIGAVISALRGELGLLRLTWADYHRANQEILRSLCSLQREIRALRRRKQDESQGPYSIYAQLEGLRCQMDGITQILLPGQQCSTKQVNRIGYLITSKLETPP